MAAFVAGMLLAASAPTAVSAIELGLVHPEPKQEVFVFLVAAALATAILVSVLSVFQHMRRGFHKRMRFMRTALNYSTHGISMVDGNDRLAFCNDAYLDIHRLERSEIRPNMPIEEVTALCATRGTSDGTTARLEPGLTSSQSVRDFDDGRAILVSQHRLPGGGRVLTYADFTEQRNLAKQLASNKLFLEMVIDNIPVSVSVKRISDRRYVLVNRVFEQFTKINREAIVGKCAAEAFSPEIARVIIDADNATIASPAGALSTETVIMRGRKQCVMAVQRVVVHDEQQRPELLVNLFSDITEKRNLTNEVEETKKFLEFVLDHIPVGVIVKAVPDHKYLLINRSGEKFLNVDRTHALHRTIDDIYPVERAAMVRHRDGKAIRNPGELVVNEYPVKTGDSMELYLTRRIAVTDAAGAPRYIVQTAENVTNQRQAEARMAHMAYHDGLTDLPNRVAFAQALEQMIEACAGAEEFAVITLDLDRFKEVNDVFGPAIGDRLLVEASKRIQDAAMGAVVARLGGDEFGLIVDGVQPQTGQQLAETLIEVMRAEFVIDGKTVRFGCTAGMSIFPRDATDAASLLANANVALFRAKQQARGSLRVFEPEMDQQIRDRRAMHLDLSNALKNDELRLNYQPLARIGCDVIGFEALVRWAHPTRGIVSPGMFIPLAEESGLIVEIGEWILREACREAASWHKPLQIAVNLSPVQFLHGDLVSLVHSILLETGLTPGRLELEITEGVLISDPERGLALLRRLKALGVCIAMDDFGSGYSSLSYLQSFPFDKIKIDRAFIMNLGINLQSAAIVRAVIGLGHGLDIPIVAEGVETRDQLDFLAEERCDQVQGYYIGRPAPIAEYADLIRASDGSDPHRLNPSSIRKAG